jgi:uncharacterized tellurite resistance protein B-like protein
MVVQQKKRIKKTEIVVSFFIFDRLLFYKNTILMETYQEKISLLQEMIDFALVDGALHDREYDFLEIVSQELEIDKATFLKLFANRGQSKVIKDEFNRICQFYRLALLMHSDGVLHEREQVKINELGINMGLNPYAMKRVLQLMKASPNQMVSAEVLLAIFSEQHN